MKEELSMNKQVKPVVIGTIGAGYAAHLHGNGYEKVSGVPIRLKTVCDLNLDLANQVKERYGYEQAITNFDDMLADPEIDVIDIVHPSFPPLLHGHQGPEGGKHVICEKPLTGYFGKPGEENVGRTEKAKMYREVMAIMDELKEVVDSTDKKFLYAENFVYATPVQKAAEIIRAKKSKVLFMKGEESLKGSSSPWLASGTRLAAASWSAPVPIPSLACCG